MKLSNINSWVWLSGLGFLVIIGISPWAYSAPKVRAEAPVIVTIDAFQFQPDHLEIKRGMSVIFINKDSVPHTVSPKLNAHFAGTGLIAGSTRHKVIFEKAGDQHYSCDFHPSMMGVVSVR